MIVRKELADNFCLYANFKTTLNCSNWAKKSLKNHESDIRQYNYDLEIFEGAKTHDKIWNATQKHWATHEGMNFKAEAGSEVNVLGKKNFGMDGFF